MRSENKSFYHFIIHEVNEDGTTKPNYFTTAKKICEHYNISRPTIYRLLNNPNANTNFPHKIERKFVHTSIAEYI
jgi:predicted DNA-binding transcriptional regulator AlpA